MDYKYGFCRGFTHQWRYKEKIEIVQMRTATGRRVERRIVEATCDGCPTRKVVPVSPGGKKDQSRYKHPKDYKLEKGTSLDSLRLDAMRPYIRRRRSSR